MNSSNRIRDVADEMEVDYCFHSASGLIKPLSNNHSVPGGTLRQNRSGAANVNKDTLFLINKVPGDKPPA